MEPNFSTLEALAQMGLTLLGFSGLVIAFREHMSPEQGKPHHAFSNPERMMFWAMVFNSLAVASLAMLPGSLYQLLNSEDITWIVVYATTSLYAAAIATWWYFGAIRKKDEWAAIGSLFYYRILFFIWIYALVVAICQFLGAFGIIIPKSIGVFTFVAWGGFLSAALQFLFFVNRLMNPPKHARQGGKSTM